MRGPVTTFAASMVGLLTAVVAAQQPPSSGAQPPPPVFRAGTDLVEVDAVAYDKAGRFVPDLRASDFEIVDNGQPKPVELMTLVRSAAPAGAAQAAAAVPDESLHAPGAGTSAPPRRVFIVLFDDDHLSSGGFKRVRAAGKALFSKAFQPGDIGGVVSGGQMINKRLTSDRAELLKDIDAAHPSGKAKSNVLDQRDWPRMTDVEAVRIHFDSDDQAFNAVYGLACTDQPDSCMRIDVRSIIREKATQMAQTSRVQSETTLRSLAGLLTGLGSFAGRKTVLLLTEGFMSEESWPIVEQAVATAARSDAVVYTLDARGLDRTPLGDRLTGTDPGNNQSYTQMLSLEDFQGDAMNSLAVDTGGFVVRNTNYFDKAVDQIAGEAGTYYLLGFRPGASDGKYHSLSVRITRPGLTLRARRGYIASVRPLPTVEALLTPIAPSMLPGVEAVERAPDLSTTPTPSVAAAASPRSAPAAAGGSPVASAAAGVHLRPDAVEHAASLAAQAPPDADATQGWEAYQRGDVESARLSLGRAAARADARPWVSYALGQSQYALRSYEDAAQTWERVRGAAPEFEPVYFDLVDAYLQLRDYDRATHVLRDAGKRWPNDAEVYEALGVVQTRRGVLSEAVNSFEQAVARAPKDATGYFNLGQAFELRYFRTSRYVAQTGTTYRHDDYRQAAIVNYTKYLEMGGPLAAAAREGLARLGWTGK